MVVQEVGGWEELREVAQTKEVCLREGIRTRVLWESLREKETLISLSLDLRRASFFFFKCHLISTLQLNASSIFETFMHAIQIYMTAIFRLESVTS